MDKAEYEKDMSIKAKRSVREERRIDVAASKPPKIATRLRDYKAGKDKLVKALAEAGQRESALLLKNWDEMDANAEAMEKSLEKGWIESLREAVGRPAAGGLVDGAAPDPTPPRENLDKDEENDKKIKQKKEEYKNINDKAPDPFKQNLKLAVPKKNRPKASVIKKDEVVEKAGEVKPFGTRIVDEKNNVKRKQGRVGDERVDAAGKDRAIQQWAKGGKQSTKVEVAAQAKADQEKSKQNPVKGMSDIDPEELKAMTERANKKKES